jgi:ElaB/YqjD/DUF883 family membrane-anchored ribosome-binding protein
MEKTVNSSTNASNKDSFKNTPHAGGSANASSASTSSAAGDIKSAIASGDVKGTMNEMKSAIVDQAGPAMSYLKDGFSTISDRSQVYVKDAGALIRKYPFYSLLGAVAVGAFLGMAIRPSSKNA